MKLGCSSGPWARRGSRGFALFEVILALAVLSISLSAVFYLVGDSLRGGRRAYDKAEAALLAQSLLEQVGSEQPLQVGLFSGTFSNGYRWHVIIEPFGNMTERQLWPVGAYKVASEVSWDEGARPQTFRLTTLRLGAKAAPP